MLVEFVISKNLRRRHLTYDQQVGLAVKLRVMLTEEASKRVGGRPGKGKPTPKSEEVSGESAAQAAKLFDVGRTAVMEIAAEQKYDPTVADKLIARHTTVAAVRNQALRRKAGAALAPITELDMANHDNTFTITEDCAVVQCQAVISEPPLGTGLEVWDATQLQDFTTAWAGRWNACGAEAIAIFCRQAIVFELRRSLDAALSNYEFQHLLIVVDRSGELAPARNLLQIWQPVLVYIRRGCNSFPPTRKLWGKTELVFPDTHILSAPGRLSQGGAAGVGV